MKTINFFAVVWVFIAGAALLVPHTSEAYFTTKQNAFTVNGTVGVYTIDFAFGHKNHDILIPVRAISTSTLTRTAISYQVHNASGAPHGGSSVGIILSDAPIKDGMYVIEKGTTARLTLLVLHTRITDTPEADTRLQVTQLPFSFDGKQDLQLNPSELKYYVSPTIDLDGKMRTTF